MPEAKMMFYDIECLKNVFTLCNLNSLNGARDMLNVYILCLDTDIVGEYSPDISFSAELHDCIGKRIYAANKNFHGDIQFLDLRSPRLNLHLMNTFGADDSCDYVNQRISNRFAKLNGYKSLVKDTDANYDPAEHPYIFGYNSANYDSVMLALYFNEIYSRADIAKNITEPHGGTTPELMRRYNDEIFTNFKDSMPDYLKKTGGNSSATHLIRQNMLRSGRHIDVARLNEKQQRVGLKRILGMLGRQILESDKLATGQNAVTSLDELADLIAYNTSDVVNLREVFYHKVYKGSFELKKGLLKTYPELIYNQAKSAYKPEIAPDNVRNNRLYIDSSSAQLAARTLCPYGELNDIRHVSFMYPSENRAEELGIPRVNVLEECNKFFNSLYGDRPELQCLSEWKRLYRYYKCIEGKNYNASSHQAGLYPGTYTYDSKIDVPSRNMISDPYGNKSDYYIIGDDKNLLQSKYVPTRYQLVPYDNDTSRIVTDYAGSDGFAEYTGCYIKTSAADNTVYTGQNVISDMFRYDAVHQVILKKEYRPSEHTVKNGEICDETGTPTGYYVFDGNTTLTYFDKDGESTGCYVLFGIGGIHGAEYNKTLYDFDMQTYREIENAFAACKTLYPDPLMLKQKQPKGTKWKFIYDGNEFDNKFFLKSGSTAAKAEYKDISKLKPALFKEKAKTGSYALNPKYAYTSADNCNHEDFTSYYPNMLRMMDAFYNNGLGYDRYAEIFSEKERYGKLMKDKSASDEDRAQYDVLRNGTKLILNSASGAADAAYPTPIQMNNQIISMRIIGQLFTWRIGQAQSYHGAKVVSTNTDGLFTVLETELNNRLLEQESESIHVEIEPEPCFLVSKDSNNRLEENAKKIVYSSAGGSLGCYKGPDPTKALAHPAILDFALGEYLRNADNCHQGANYLREPFNEAVGRKILENARQNMEPVKYLTMMQNITASSPGTNTFIFGEYANDPAKPKKILQHYNRVFYVKPGTDLPVYNLKTAVARAITPATKLARRKAGDKEVIHNPEALKILEQYGLTTSQIPYGKEAGFKKVSGIDENWLCYIDNRSLFELEPAELTKIIDSLETENYLTLLKNTFEKNWRNLTGQESDTDEDSKDNEDAENPE